MPTPTPKPLPTAPAGFDWTLIRSFLAALEHGSLLAGARALGLSQPTLGRHIAELEAQLGVVLFERTGRGLLPTEAALGMVESARAMEAGALQLARRVSGAQSELQGTVRISASQTVACVLLPPVLARMRQALPEVQVELVSSDAVANLLRREADIALRMVAPRQASLIARRIGKFSVGAYAHRDYLRRRGTPRTPADLLHHDLVGEDRADSLLKGFAAAGTPVRREQFVLRTDDRIAYWGAVRAGLGIGFLSDFLVKADPDLVPVLPGLKIPPLPLWLVVHREIRTNQRVRAVFEFLGRGVG